MGAPQQGVTQPPCKGEAPERRLKTQRITRYKPVLTCYGPGIFVRLPALIRFSGGSLATNERRSRLDLGPKELEARSLGLEAGSRKPEAGTCELGPGSWELGAGSWK